MATIDYENKYKALVESVKTLKEANPSDEGIQNWIKDNVPELAESEDERIRKEIISAIKEDWPGHTDWIDWLEKQGEKGTIGNEKEISFSEQKPVTDFSDLRTWKYIVDAVWTEKEGIGQYLDSSFTEEVAKKLQKRFGNIEQESIKEHNVCDFCDEKHGCVSPCPTKLIEEQKPIDKIQLGKKYKCIASPRYSTFMTGKIYKPEDKFLCSLMNFCSDCFEPIEDGEPKFHEGEWVVYDHRPYQVVELPKEGYLNLGLRGNGKIEFAPSTYCRPWTIEDAKDGDVIYSRHNTESFEWIGIFKSLDKENKRLFFYGFWHDMAKAFSVCRNEAYVLYDDFSPATKEQRDTLMNAMADAGYTFDFEKKELKKIKNEIEIPYGAKDSELIAESYYIPKGFHAEIDDDKVVIKKGEKPTVWSEEDEVAVKDICDWLNRLSMTFVGNQSIVCQEEIKWLKSLKDRIQPKVELTQLDKNILEAAIAFVAQNDHFNCWRGVDKHTVLSALHSLRPKKQWKPSKEQMDALNDVISSRDIKYDVLSELWKDLKKLKE